MFGLFKRKMAPEGPFEFTDEIRIERPMAAVYRLLDWSDPLNAQKAQGDMLTPGDGAGQWRLVVTGLENHEYLIALVASEMPVRYVYDCNVVPMIGRLVRTREAYSLAPLAGGACMVKLAVTAQLVPRLTARQFAHEEKLLSASCYNAVARLKIHAEKGADAARDAEMDESNGFRIRL